MRVGDTLTVLSQMINFVIFVYFTLVLLKLNVLDAFGLLISAVGILASLIASIVSALD